MNYISVLDSAEGKQRPKVRTHRTMFAFILWTIVLSTVVGCSRAPERSGPEPMRQPSVGDTKPNDKAPAPASSPETAEDLVREQIRLMNQLAEALEQKEPRDKQDAIQKQLDACENKLRNMNLGAAERTKLKALDAEFDQAAARLGRAKADAKNR
jgi:hypothetical protein